MNRGKQLKKFFSFLLSLCIMFNSAYTVFATETANSQSASSITEQEIQAKVNQKKQITYNLVYSQLKEQNALELLDVYEKILYPMIEAEVANEYGQKSTTAGTSYYAPNGGLLQYKFSSGGDYTTEVAITGLDYDNSYYFVLSNSQFTVFNVVQTILGFIPNAGYFASALFTMTSAVSGAAKSDILAAQGYALTINTYNSPSGAKASVVTGWTDRFRLTVTTSGAYDINFTAYPKTNPWG